MNAFSKFNRIIRCDWLHYEPQDEEEAYDDLIQRGTVASAIAQYEQTAINNSQRPSEQQQQQHQHQQSNNNNNTIPTCRQQAVSGASLLLNLFRRSNNNESSSSNQYNSIETQAERVTATVRVKTSKKQTCAMCQTNIFPTEESTTARNRTYHTSCFKCHLCKSRLKNHPDEQHHQVVVVGGNNKHLYLQCSRCKLDSEQTHKPRQLSRKAGERIVVENEEQGDIVRVVDAIGDDLEEAIFAMIPRCATCGGDFLQYKGELSIIGSLKYHKECLLTGKPSASTASLTVSPKLAAKYLPQDLILRLTLESGKLATTLFFVWKDREEALKSIRNSMNGAVSVSYHLDDDARANPNHPTNKNYAKKTQLLLENKDDLNSLKLDVVGADQISPELPVQLGPLSIQVDGSLEGKIGYRKYGLKHTLVLRVPCENKGSRGNELVLELLHCELVVCIDGGDEV